MQPSALANLEYADAICHAKYFNMLFVLFSPPRWSFVALLPTKRLTKTALLLKTVTVLHVPVWGTLAIKNRTSWGHQDGSRWPMRAASWPFRVLPRDPCHSPAVYFLSLTHFSPHFSPSSAHLIHCTNLSTLGLCSAEPVSSSLHILPGRIGLLFSFLLFKG